MLPLAVSVPTKMAVYNYIKKLKRHAWIPPAPSHSHSRPRRPLVPPSSGQSRHADTRICSNTMQGECLSLSQQSHACKVPVVPNVPNHHALTTVHADAGPVGPCQAAKPSQLLVHALAVLVHARTRCISADSSRCSQAALCAMHARLLAARAPDKHIGATPTHCHLHTSAFHLRVSGGCDMP